LEARPASIAGKLFDAAGQPVAGATITLRDDAGNPVGSFTTLADGSFGATGLKPGTYTLQARTADGKMVDSTIKLTGGEISTVELKLP
jgi:protocatechuate 3,4-dioxygenase beta subunit